MTGRPPLQVSLLRGINVGGRTLVAMARLREIYEAMGVHDVRTHLQSGNVVLRSDRDPDNVSREAEEALQRDLGLKIRVLGRTHADLARIVAHDPYPEADPSRHVVVFLSAEPPAEALTRMMASATLGERIIERGREVHIHYPDGIAGSRVGAAGIERGGIVATARNWRTVTRLHEMSAPEG